MNVYKVGVQIAVSGNANAFMNQFIHHLTGAHVKVQKLNSALKTLAVSAAAGAAGFGLAKGIGHIVSEGNKLVKIQQNMAMAGATATEVQHAYAKAWELTAKHKNVSAEAALKTMNDARGIFGSQEAGVHEAPEFVRAMSFLKAYEGGKHAAHSDLGGEIAAAMKSGEIAGKIDPKDMHEHIAALVGMKVAFGEQVKVGQYLTAQRNAGAGARNWDDDFRYGIFGALVQENGQSAGTMAMTAFQKIVAGTGNKLSAVNAMRNMGLTNDDKIDINPKTDKVRSVQPGFVRGADLFAANPLKWVEQYLAPALAKKTAGLGDDERKIRESQLISGMFQDRNAAKFLLELLQQGPKLHKDAALAATGAKNYNADKGEYVDKSFDGQVQAFQTQWNNLMQALGAPAVATATGALKSINDTLSGMSQWAALNPENARAIVESLTVAATALTTGAVVGLASMLGPVGWFTLGIAAIGAAMEYFDPGSFETFKNFFQQIPTFVADAVKTWPGVVQGAISEMASAIGSAISNAIKSIVNFVKPAAGDGADREGAGKAVGDRLRGRQGALPTVAGTEKHASAGNVYLDGHKVGSHVASNIAGRAGIGASNVAGFDASAHAMPYDYNPVG